MIGVGLHLWLYNTVLVDTFYSAPSQLANAVVGASAVPLGMVIMREVGVGRIATLCGGAFLAVNTVLAIVSTAGMAIRSWARSRLASPKEASRRATRRMTIQSFVMALVWGAMPVVLLPAIGPTHQLIVACLMAGMISAGGFTLSTVPSAGLVYTWTMSVASAGALLLCRVDAYVVSAVFLMIYAVFISRNTFSTKSYFPIDTPPDKTSKSS